MLGLQKCQASHWPIVLVLSIAAILFVYRIGAESLWLDELLSVEDVITGRGLPPNNLIRPLYYILLKIWIQVSDSDTWLRGLGVAWGLAAVWFTYRLGRWAAGETVGWVSALLLALSPLFIDRIQEVRMYGLSTFLGVAGTLVLAQALTNPTRSAKLWWTGLRLLALLTTPLNVVLLVPDALLVGLKCRLRWRSLWNFGLYFVLLGFLWLPFCIATAMATDEYAESGHVVDQVSPRLIEIVRVFRLLAVWPYEIKLPGLAGQFYVGTHGLFAALIGLGLISSLALLYKGRSSRLLAIAIWALIPLGLIFLASHVFFSIWRDRYLAFATPYVLILLAASFMQLWHRIRPLAVAVALIYLVAVGGGLTYYYTVQDHLNYRGIIETINANEQPGDTIVWALNHTRSSSPLVHYYHGANPIILRENDAPRPEIVDGVNVTPEILDAWLDQIPPVPDRLWLVTWLQYQNADLFKAVVANRFDLQLHRQFIAYPEQIDLKDRTINVFLVEPRR